MSQACRIDANSYAQYTALAQMWTLLADEAGTWRATFNRAQDAFNEAQVVQQQQAQPKKPEGDKVGRLRMTALTRFARIIAGVGSSGRDGLGRELELRCGCSLLSVPR